MARAELSGAFPRSERLIEATRALDRARATVGEVESALVEDIRAVASLQTGAGLDVIVDGQLNWQDQFRPFTQLFAGVEAGGLTRWFDNNTFFRKPIIRSKVNFAGDGLDQFFRSSLLPLSVPKKAILPGAYTFAVLSQNDAYSSRGELIDALAHCFREVAAKLVNLGYSHIQFNEPALCTQGASGGDIELTQRAYETITKGLGATTTLATYFGDAGNLFPRILDFPIDCISVDLYSTSLESIGEYDFDHGLGCGCLDGRNSLLEEPKELSRVASLIRDRLEPKFMIIQPNCDLDFLPRPIAEKKVRILGQARKLVN